MHIDIDTLLKISKINWTKDMSSLRKDLEAIFDLLSSLPEPRNLDNSHLIKYATLSKDEYDKKAEKSDIIKNQDMYKI